MDVLPEPSRVFNPVALQRDVVDDQDHDQEQEDADEMRDIADGIDNQLKELDNDVDDLNLNEDDDSDDDELLVHNGVMAGGGVGITSAPLAPSSDMDRQFKERMFL